MEEKTTINEIDEREEEIKHGFAEKALTRIRNKKQYIRFRVLLHLYCKRYNKWIHNHIPDEEELKKQSLEKFKIEPKFSIVIPLYKTPKKFLDSVIKSLINQSYSNWELCLSDGSGKESPIKDMLEKWKSKDSRIKVCYNDKQLQISENTNRALEMVSGDYIVFGDHDDLFAPNALYECVKEINTCPSLDMIYTDEDKVNSKGTKYFEPHLKSDFNLDMIRSTNYFCHMFVVKKTIYDKVGGLRSKFDGAQDYDFVLRCVEKSKIIRHIPKILYHWRVHKESTASNQDSKSYAFENGRLALQDYYDRQNINAKVSKTYINGNVVNGVYHTNYEIKGNPLVSIVIPNKDHVKDLDKCIKSILKYISYKNFEIIVIENNSGDSETFEYYEQIQKLDKRIRVVEYKTNEFNYSKINNFGVDNSKGDYILFLNNDTKFNHDNTFKELLSNCMRSEIGCVGAKLFYPDNTIQHAGVVMGVCGVASHGFINYPATSPGYCIRLWVSQNYSAVTAACMMIKKSIFKEIGGFDEEFAVAYNDIDLCMRVRKAGYLITFTPHTSVIHFESKSRGYEDTPEKQKRFQKEINLFKSKWGDVLAKGDEYYNKNLTTDKTDFTIDFNRW